MDDLISRKAALDALWKAPYEYEDETEKQFQDSENLDLKDWIPQRPSIFVQSMIDRQAILALPSAQPERKKGRWIDMDDHVMCSCCGATHYGSDKNFCPNCGADMRGEQDG